MSTLTKTLMDAVLKGMTFQLKLDNFPEFIFALCRILTGFGAAGLLLAAFLQKEVIQYPHEIHFDQFLIEQCSSILLIYHIVFPSLPLAQLNANKTRHSGLHKPLAKYSDEEESEADDDQEIALPKPKTLFEQIPDKALLGQLAKDFDTYKNGLNAQLRSLFALTITQWVSPSVTAALEADERYITILAQQNVFALFRLLEEMCIRLGGDRIDDLLQSIRDTKQNGSNISELKGQLDKFFASLTAYGAPPTDREKTRALLHSLTQLKFRDNLLSFHSEATLPKYEAVCRTLQATEDAHAAINKQLGLSDPDSSKPLPMLAAVTGGQTAFCGICFQRTLTRYGKGNKFPHSENVCKHKDWESRT